MIDEMSADGTRQLVEERIAEERRRYEVKFDCRYIKQYHEVSFAVPRELIDSRDTPAIAAAFNAEHNRLYGYSLEAEKTPIEIINVRVQAIGITDKPTYRQEAWGGTDASGALKGKRSMYIPETKTFRDTPVYDGHRMRFGNRIEGPAMIEQVTTAIFVSDSYDCAVDALGSFVIWQKGREDLAAACFKQTEEALA
jgi:N-methylhydantoinase A